MGSYSWTLSVSVSVSVSVSLGVDIEDWRLKMSDERRVMSDEEIEAGLRGRKSSSFVVLSCSALILAHSAHSVRSMLRRVASPAGFSFNNQVFRMTIIIIGVHLLVSESDWDCQVLYLANLRPFAF